jgi:integrase/recombinase XerD
MWLCPCPVPVGSPEVSVSNLARLAHWDAAVVAYLANRRSLGRIYEEEEQILRSLRRQMVSARVADLDQTIFDRWRKTFAHLHPNTRYGYERAVYNFCSYRHRCEPRCFLPDPASFARRRPHALPTIIKPDQIARMLELTSIVRPTSRSPLWPAILRLSIVLLYTAGLRRRELVRLTVGDADAQHGVLRIRESKHHKGRWVPLSPSAAAELRAYVRARMSSKFKTLPEAPLLCRGGDGTRSYSGHTLSQRLQQMMAAAGMRTREGRTPRIADLRHSFATAALLRWYKAGADVQVNLPRLALYMGHVNIVSTAHYLRWMPEVLALASDRFERFCASVPLQEPS